MKLTHEMRVLIFARRSGTAEMRVELSPDFPGRRGPQNDGDRFYTDDHDLSHLFDAAESLLRYVPKKLLSPRLRHIGY